MAVTKISEYRGRAMVAVLRELLFRALKGEIQSFAFSVSFDADEHKIGFLGNYKTNPKEALVAATSMSMKLTEAEEAYKAAAAKAA